MKGKGEMVNETRTDEEYHISTWFDGDLTTTKIYHLPTGLHAAGNARRYTEDNYDEEIGYQLSYYRAFERLSNKLARYIVRNLAV